MVRIGVLSFKDTTNFGTVLQCFSLLHVLNQKASAVLLDIDLFAVQGRTKVGVATHLLEGVRHPIRTFKKVLRQKWMKQKQAAFCQFVSTNIPLSREKYVCKEDLLKISSSDYDVVLLGSDQAWNPYSGTFGDLWMLDFVQDPMIKKCAYGPSAGVRLNRCSEDVIAFFRKYLGGFEYVSSREKENCVFLEAVCERRVPFVIDPVLLLPKEDWLRLISKTPRVSSVLYLLDKNIEAQKCINKFFGNDFLDISGTFDNARIFPRKNENRSLGPLDFVSLISGAGFVVTDSYHGVLFCLLFHISFLCFKRFSDSDPKSQNERIACVLEAVGLEKRFLDAFANWGSASPIVSDAEWRAVDERLEAMRKDSLAFLFEACGIHD